MRKVKMLLLFFAITFLFGCDFNLNTDLIVFEIKDNITIPISQYENYNWGKVIKIRYQGKILNISDAKITLVSGEIKAGELCKHEISYQIGFSKASEFFYVEIINDEYRVKDILSLNKNTNVAIKGTVSLENEIGFILTDETGSIFVKNENKEQITKGNTIYVEGEYNFDNGHEIILSSFSVTNEDAEISIPINLTNSDFSTLQSSYAENYLIEHVKLIAAVIVNDNEVLLKVGNSYLEINSNALDEKTLLLQYVNQTVLVSGWIYKLNSTKLSMMIDCIDYVYQEGTSASDIPTIDVASSYYFYTSINNVCDLTSYFNAIDNEDGIIRITTDMIHGEIKNGQNIITAIVTDSDKNTTSASIIIEVNEYKVRDTFESNKIIDEYGTPTTGDVDVLVIPISFPNYQANDTMLNNIEKAFFGNENDTGWESLASYYKESSYGKLNINGDVTEWYTPKRTQSYYAEYEDDDDYVYGSTILLEEALTYFKNKYDYTKYDSNYDGYIDAVYLIYNTPIGGNGSLAQQEFYWAFTYWDMAADSRNYSKTKGYSYVFMSYDFFLEDLMYSDKNITLNCETLIHETGHLFNLEDYYDYDEYDHFNNDGGYCGADMMEYNIGDHCPYSKILLDWIEPTVISKDGIYELPSFTLTGATFLIEANGSFNSIFDEYYLIDFYTFDGLNKLEMPSFFNTSRNYAGVRVSHVNANLTYDDGFFPTFTYNNSNTKYKQIMMLEADYRGKFDLNSSSSEGAQLKDFYQVGDVFGTGYYSKYKSYSGNFLPFTMEVININNNYATVKINFK